MAGQAPLPLTCFIDKERPCNQSCRAFKNDTCEILDSISSLKSSAKKVVAAWTSLARALERRPPPRP